MNYYIDFDNTLYNTCMLKDKMLNALAESAKSQKGIDILEECYLLFNEDNIYDIYELSKYMSDKYELDLSILTNSLNNIILTSSNCLFEDSIPFLEKLKAKGHNLFLLSYALGNLNYQTSKILGSNISKYFDVLYITTKQKYDLDIDYSNGIFIDDNPDDLQGLYSKGARKVIRIRREENKYSVYDLNNSEIEEYNNFDQIGGI